jgi:uncharacterized protein YdhG (YjbR/CyaY superfamily)
MAKTNFKSVDQYIATHPDDVQVILQRVRGAIRRALPRAEEAISYQIPAYTVDGSRVIYFAGWKQHYSLYPVSDRVAAGFKAELARYERSKGTLRLPLSEPVPVTLIQRIAKCLAQEAAARRTRTSPGKSRRRPSK